MDGWIDGVKGRIRGKGVGDIVVDGEKSMNTLASRQQVHGSNLDHEMMPGDACMILTKGQIALTCHFHLGQVNGAKGFAVMPGYSYAPHALSGKMEKGSLRSNKGRNWSILDRAPTLRRGDSRLGVQSISSGPNHPGLGMDANA
ncbi:hypothetical protein PIB30_073373 [Stylosanthes scabra]|uniref:Uncharacterized protein n=1 Tax=Stylosanthes scabra TaxID=79078 RepID=A0ABU6ZN12_9FABA|nr:hypothetical protein [Stylosanthes scabra]